MEDAKCRDARGQESPGWLILPLTCHHRAGQNACQAREEPGSSINTLFIAVRLCPQRSHQPRRISLSLGIVQTEFKSSLAILLSLGTSEEAAGKSL